MDSGDMQTSEPLEFLAFLAHDACGACVFAADGDEPWVPFVRELRSILDLLVSTPNAPVWDLAFYREHSSMAWGAIWEAVARLASLALRELSWTAYVPDISCVTLLDEYSYSAYSAQFTSDRNA